MPLLLANTWVIVVEVVVTPIMVVVVVVVAANIETPTVILIVVILIAEASATRTAILTVEIAEIGVIVAAQHRHAVEGTRLTTDVAEAIQEALQGAVALHEVVGVGTMTLLPTTLRRHQQTEILNAGKGLIMKLVYYSYRIRSWYDGSYMVKK